MGIVRIDVPARVAIFLIQERFCTARELAEVCECSTRTIYRAIDVLSPYLPIITEKGPGGGIRLLDK